MIAGAGLRRLVRSLLHILEALRHSRAEVIHPLGDVASLAASIRMRAAAVFIVMVKFGEKTAI